jgi:hypothetical protein
MQSFALTEAGRQKQTKLMERPKKNEYKTYV